MQNQKEYFEPVVKECTRCKKKLDYRPTTDKESEDGLYSVILETYHIDAGILIEKEGNKNWKRGMFDWPYDINEDLCLECGIKFQQMMEDFMAKVDTHNVRPLSGRRMDDLK